MASRNDHYNNGIAGHRIKADAAGIRIPTSGISVRYLSIPVPDWVPLFRYQTGFGVDIFVHSSTQTDRMPESPAFWHSSRKARTHLGRGQPDRLQEPV